MSDSKLKHATTVASNGKA